MEYKLQIKLLNKEIQEKKILNNINLDVKKSEIYGIIGSNGAGKTTLFNTILGTESKDSGSVILDGEEVIPPYDNFTKSKLGYLPDEPIFLEHLTGLENLKYISYIYKKPLTDSEIYKVMKNFNIYNAREQICKYYSKGMKQKLALATMYIGEADIYILDEPTIGLDPASVIDLKNHLLKLKDSGKTIILSTHDMYFLNDLADNIAIMNNGEIIWKGTPAELLLKTKKTTIDESMYSLLTNHQVV